MGLGNPVTIAAMLAIRGAVRDIIKRTLTSLFAVPQPVASTTSSPSRSSPLRSPSPWLRQTRRAFGAEVADSTPATDAVAALDPVHAKERIAYDDACSPASRDDELFAEGADEPRARRLTASQRAQLTPLPGHRPGRNNLEQSGRDFLPKPGNLRAKRDGSIDRVPRGGVGR